jgi:hypothetical protein
MIPIKKGITGTDIPNIAVETSDSSIPRKPILVEGGPAPEPITVTPLTVTENGTHDAGENAAYNPVTVNVPPSLPSQILESDWNILDATTTNGCWNTVTNTALATNNFGGFNQGYITGRSAKALLDLFTPGSIKRVVIKTGEFDRTQETTDNTQQLFRLITESSHFTMRWLNDTGRWQISDQSGSQVYVDGTILPKYSFDNTTFEIIYGARYINGELYRGIKENGNITANYNSKFAVYINGVEVATNEIVVADGTSHIARIQLAVQNAWVGAKFENVKVYNVTDCYNKYYESEVE